MTLQNFSKEFDRYFIPFVRKALKKYKTIIQDEELFQAIQHLEIYVQGGKRLRPYGVYLGLSERKKTPRKEDWLVMISVELIHVLALIHDDIIDKALTRRDVASVNGNIEKEHTIVRGSLTHYATSQAILIGDLMFSLAFQALAESGARLPVQQKIHQLLDEVILGQMIDVKLGAVKEVSKDMIIRKSKYKTALYTFARPFEIGACLAKVPPQKQKDLASIGEHLGICYQIQDDFLDVFGNETILKKDIMNDVREGQQTLITHYFFTRANDEQKKLFLKHFGTPFSEKYNAIIRSLFMETGVDTIVHKEMVEWFEKTKRKVRSSSLSTQTQVHILDLIETLRKRI